MSTDRPISLDQALAELAAWRELALSLDELSLLDPDGDGAGRIKAAERRHKTALAALRDLGIDVDQARTGRGGA